MKIDITTIKGLTPVEENQETVIAFLKQDLELGPTELETLLSDANDGQTAEYSRRCFSVEKENVTVPPESKILSTKKTL